MGENHPDVMRYSGRTGRYILKLTLDSIAESEEPLADLLSIAYEESKE